MTNTKDRIQSIANHLDPANSIKDEALEKSEWKVNTIAYFAIKITYSLIVERNS